MSGQAFDPAADFLLDLQPLNLYERVNTRDEYQIRCKGCGEELTLREAAKHHRKHKRERARARARETQAARERGLRAARAARLSKAR